MPDQETIERAKEDKKEGKSPSTQAGEFVREEMHHIREGKHGAASTKQAIAIGLSKARSSGVKLSAPKNSSAETRRKAAQDDQAGEQKGHKISQKRSRATTNALRKKPKRPASHQALSRQAHKAAGQRTKRSRSQAAVKAARTRKAA